VTAARLAEGKLAEGKIADGKLAEGTGARERLLEAAATLIIARETIDISLAEIAAQAGLNAALVKYYFGSKSGLLLALLRRDAARALQEMQALLAMRISPTEKMRLHLRGIMRAYCRSPYLNRLLHAMLTGSDEAAVAEIHDGLVRPVMQCERAILEAGAAAGEFRAVDPMLFYLAAVGACDQFMHAERLFRLSAGTAPHADFSTRYMGFVEDMVLASLRPGHATPPKRTTP
jgi:AcrR family transcriptional regulator